MHIKDVPVKGYKTDFAGFELDVSKIELHSANEREIHLPYTGPTSSLHSLGWRMIQSPHRNNIKTNQSQSAADTALWFLLLSGGEASALYPFY